MLKDELEFESRYYLAHSNKLRKEASEMLTVANDLLELSVEAWGKSRREVAG